MKADAQSSTEQEALQWAVEFFDRHSAYLHASQNAIMEEFERRARQYLANKLKQGEPLDSVEGGMAADYLRPPNNRRPGPIRPGPKRGDKNSRDLAIARAVMGIVKKYGLAPTRNVSTECASAASIVRKALQRSADIKLKEAAINKIWQSHKMVVELYEASEKIATIS
jgi:hypothetical protein